MNNISQGSYWKQDANGIHTNYKIGLNGQDSVAANSLQALEPIYSQNGITTATQCAAAHVTLAPSAAPANTEGEFYYDSTAHKLKVRGAAGFETVTSA